jgi:hypothetical protein
MSERNLDAEDLQIVLDYGRVIYRSGAKFYFLGRRDLPEFLQRTHRRLVGTTIVTVKSMIKTVYRNGRAIASIKRKRKRKISGSPFRPHRY